DLVALLDRLVAERVLLVHGDEGRAERRFQFRELLGEPVEQRADRVLAVKLQRGFRHSCAVPKCGKKPDSDLHQSATPEHYRRTCRRASRPGGWPRCAFRGRQLWPYRRS